jgi:transcriptional regulator with XRE-family HTH domain
MDEAIAEGIRTLRSTHGWTQEQLAGRLRELGFIEWTRSMVAALETRRRQISAEDLFSMSLALGVPPGGLIEQGLLWIRLPGGVVTGADTVRKVLSGELDLGSPPRAAAVSDSFADLPSDRKEQYKGMMAMRGSVSAVDLASRGELERRIARRNGVSPREVAEIALRLFGRSATDERDARAPSRPGPRRYASRRVREEIEAGLRGD